MSASQRRKGRAWEQAVARQCREIFGAEVKRGWQSRQGHDAPDVVVPGPWWLECKCGAAPNIRAAMRQASSSAPPGQYPVVVSKRDRETPLVTMRLDDWLEIVGQWWKARTA